MQQPQRCALARRLALAVLCAGAVGWVGTAGPAAAASAQEDGKRRPKDARPSVSLRASPPVSFSPARVFVVAELKGGDDDYEEFYCPTVEWDWGDGTRSEARFDCEPFEAGTSEIRRRFSAEHIYRMAGDFRVQFRLKQKSRIVLSARANVKVRPGLRDMSIGPGPRQP
jgi:hypothetical protein